MEAVIIITVLVLLQYTYFGIQVGGIRQKTGTKAPEQSGPPEFMRMNRVHLNTLEQLPVFLPALWMYGYYVNPLWAAGIGVVFLIGRFIYSGAYQKDPATRSIGFMMTVMPSAVMLLWVLVVAVLKYV